MKTRYTNNHVLFIGLLCLAGFGPATPAQVIFSSDFESNTAGFTPSGSLTSLGRMSLPTDGGGLSSPNQSMWLGPLGQGVAKSGSLSETVTLNLTGLTAGQQYRVAFDLFIGASWDGAATFYGPNSWRLTIDGQSLVNTIFSNVKQGVNAGAYSPQRYSDTTYTSTTGQDFDRFIGADFSHSANQDGNYAGDYAIYRFGRGAGNRS